MSRNLSTGLANELSEREREILQLVATGASNKQIAEKLSISTNTVKVHLRNVFAKIGVASRTEATIYAIRDGLVQIGGIATEKPDDVAPPILYSMSAASTILSSTPPADKTINERRQYWRLGIVGLTFLILGLIGLLGTIRQSSIAVSASPEPLSSARPRWQSRTALPTARSALAAVLYEDQIYAIGGETAQGPTGIFERYDLVSDMWTVLSPKPTAVADVSAAVIGRQIFVPGGRLDSEYIQISDRLEVYDLRQGRWEQRAKLPEPVSAYALATFEGKIYLLGGWNGTRYLDSVYEYAPDQDKWRKVAPLSIPRGYSGATVIGNKIFVIGGYDGKDALATNEIYSPDPVDGNEPAWREGASLPVGRYGMGVASISNIIYVIGGEGAPAENLPPMGYFQQDDRWLTFDPPFSESWAYMATIPQGTSIYGVGGQVKGAPASQIWVYQALYTLLIPSIR